MASYYVWSGATGGGTGADWANAYTTLVTAMTSKAAGDIFYLAHDHAETLGSAKVIPAIGTLAAPCRIHCVDRAGSVPPVAADLRTTGSITTTGVSTITLNGVNSWYGVIIRSGSGASTSPLTISASNYFQNCSIGTLSTNTSASSFTFTSAGQKVVLENTTVINGAAGQTMNVTGNLHWRNTAAAWGNVAASTLFIASLQGTVYIEGVGFQQGTNLTIVSAPSNRFLFTMKDCRLPTGTITTSLASATSDNPTITMIRCDSGDTNYRSERHSYSGSQTTDIATVNAGGASDGTTPISWKIVTNANAKWDNPFECLPITVWNETTGSSKTVTIEGIWDDAAVTTLNDEIWIDVEYLGTSGYSIASKATSGKASFLAAGTSNPAGNGVWSAGTFEFKMSVTITPQEKGPFTIYVRVARPSMTYYIDPQPVIT